MRLNLMRAAVFTAALLCTTGAFAQEAKTLAISTIVEVPALLETRDGALEALAERGYVVGKNLTVDYQNANGSMPTQQQIAKKFAGNQVDAIMSITTPTSQAIVAATSDIPIVFATVTDPIKAGLIKSFEPSGTNITSVSDEAPLAEQLRFIQEIIPGIKKMGFIYNPGLDNSLSTLAALKALATEAGIEIVESPAPTTNEVIQATAKLVGNVDAIYVPNDTTVVAALEAVIKVGQDTDTPIFAGETGAVDRGAIASVGLDYLQIGHAAGVMLADVFDGKSPGEITPIIAYKSLSAFKVSVNKAAAAEMGVTLSDAVLARATKVIE